MTFKHTLSCVYRKGCPSITKCNSAERCLQLHSTTTSTFSEATQSSKIVGSERVFEIMDAIYNMNRWEHTKEGHDFWSNITADLRSLGEQLSSGWITKPDFYKWRKEMLLYTFAAMCGCFMAGFGFAILCARTGLLKL